MKVVTVRDFRDRASEMFRSQDVILVTRDGAPAGFFLPWDTLELPLEVRREVFLRLSEQIGAQLDQAPASKRCSTISLPAAVVADANIVLSPLIGGRVRLVIASPHGPRCVTADAVALEIARYIPRLAEASLGPRAAVRRAAGHARRVEGRRRRQPAQGGRAADRRRDPHDWPTVALALPLKLPVWSQDKDLTAAGLDVFTTGELLDALRDAGHLE